MAPQRTIACRTLSHSVTALRAHVAANNLAAQDLAVQGRFSSRVIRLQCLPRLAASCRVSMARIHGAARHVRSNSDVYL